MSYPQISQIRTDFSEQNNGFRFVQITKDTPFPNLWKSVKSVEKDTTNQTIQTHPIARLMVAMI